jgi:lipoprotein signal peptidase
VRGVQAAGGTPLSGQDQSTPAPAEGEPRAEPARPRRVGLLLGVAGFVIVADVISKAIAVAHLREYSYVHVIGSFLMLTLRRNGGAAFNIGGTSMTIVFTAIAVGVVVYILRAARNLHSIGWAITLGLLLGGATGNLIDRIFRAPAPFRGDVVDWIELPHWPVFNVADSSIVCAGCLVVLLALRGIRLDGTRAVHGTSPAPDYPQPGSPQPGSLNPDSAQPGTAQPGTAQPGTAQPGTAQPGTAQPGTAQPGTAQPGSPAPDYPKMNYRKPDYPPRVADDRR